MIKWFKKIINIILVFAILLIIATVLFIPTTNVWNGILIGLSCGYISSWIFYLVVVVLKEKRDKKIINPIIKYFNQQLCDTGYIFYSTVLKTSKLSINLETLTEETLTEKTFTEDLWEEACNRTPLYRELCLIKSGGVWKSIDYLRYTIISIEAIVNKILIYILFLEPDYINLLTKILTDILSVRIKNIPLDKEITLGEVKLISLTFSKESFAYFLKLRALKDYGQKNFKEVKAL